MKYTYDYSLLEQAIRKRFKSRTEFGKAIGMEKSTLSLKLSNKREWKQSEMKTAVRVLKVNPRRINELFFKEMEK